MILKYEPASEPLHISVKWLSVPQGTAGSVSGSAFASDAGAGAIQSVWIPRDLPAAHVDPTKPIGLQVYMYIHVIIYICIEIYT